MQVYLATLNLANGQSLDIFTYFSEDHGEPTYGEIQAEAKAELERLICEQCNLVDYRQL